MLAKEEESGEDAFVGNTKRLVVVYGRIRLAFEYGCLVDGKLLMNRQNHMLHIVDPLYLLSLHTRVCRLSLCRSIGQKCDQVF